MTISAAIRAILVAYWVEVIGSILLGSLLCFVASSIVRRMPLSRTQQPAADLFWAAGVGAGERASEPSIATEKSSEISDV
jgi:hypothetical protein